jgi:hypothetical protein
MKRLAGSYEEYHWHTFEAKIHDCIEDSKHVFKIYSLQIQECVLVADLQSLI